MHDDALSRVVETANVFARVNPAQKNRIIIALKNNRHVVGFLGDGINDAPSLKISWYLYLSRACSCVFLSVLLLQLLHGTSKRQSISE
jgi:hypothetical protein